MKFLLVLIFVVGTFTPDIATASSELRQDEATSRGKRSTESSSYFFYQQPEYPRDCKEVYDQCEGQSADGVYLIKPEGSPEPFEVYRNNSIDGGGWTVFQRRLDGSVDFYRYWNDYKNGFGFSRRDFWLGNDKISYLTNQKNYELRIDLGNINYQPYFAKYNLFRISDEKTNYRLVGLGEYDSTSTMFPTYDDVLCNWRDAIINTEIGIIVVFEEYYDSLGTYNRNMSFSTRDRDNDRYSSYHCSTYYHGGWWFNYCGEYSHLNGLYTAGSTNYKSIQWYNLPGGQYHLKYAEMKVRPLPDS